MSLLGIVLAGATSNGSCPFRRSLANSCHTRDVSRIPNESIHAREVGCASKCQGADYGEVVLRFRARTIALLTLLGRGNAKNVAGMTKMTDPLSFEEDVLP